MPAKPTHRLALTLLFLLAGCGGGSDAPPTQPPPATGSFTIAASAVAPDSVAQGAQGASTITVSRSGAFAGAVSLALDGVPAGVTASLAATTVATGASSTTVTFAVGTTAAVGSYTVTVRATASGQTERTATITLVVVQRPAALRLLRSTGGTLSTAIAGVPITVPITLNWAVIPVEATMDVLSGLPSGVSAAFAPAVTAGSSVTLTLTASASATAGSYVTRIVARVSATDSAMLDVAYTIVDRATLGVTVDAAEVLVAQNGTRSATVSIVRNNFAGPVLLTAFGEPAGATVTFENNNFVGTTTGINFTATGSTPPGSYPVTIVASAPGVTADSTVVTMTVTATGAGNASVTFCGAAEDLPIWFGVGSSAGRSWVRVLPDAGNTYAFNIPTRGMLAWTTQHGPDDFRITAYAGSEAGLRSIRPAQCETPAGKSVTGLIAGLTGPTQLAQVVLGPRSPAVAPTFAAPGFSITGLPDGTLDLVATRSVLNPLSTTFEVDRVIVSRALNPANGATLATLDFTSGAAIAPETHTLSVSGAQAGEQLVGTSLFLSAGGAGITISTAVPNAGSMLPFQVVAAAQRVAGDLHQLSATAIGSTTDGAVSRTVSLLTDTPTSQTLLLGSVPAIPALDIYDNNINRSRFQTSVDLQDDYQKVMIASWSQQSGSIARQTTLFATAVIFGSGNARLRSPDFTGASGWDERWELRDALSANWSFTAFGWDVGGGVSAPRTSGTISRSYTRTGVFVR